MKACGVALVQSRVTRAELSVPRVGLNSQSPYNHTPEKVMEFHTKNPGAPCRICALTFGSIPFRLISLSSTSSQCLSRGGCCKGNPSCFPFRFCFSFCIPLPAHPLMLHLSPPTHHCSRPASCQCHAGMPHSSVPYMYLPVSVLFFISTTVRRVKRTQKPS